MGAVFVAHVEVLGAGEVGDLRPVLGNRVGGGAMAEIDALRFHDLRGGEGTGGGGHDHAGRRFFAHQIDHGRGDVFRLQCLHHFRRHQVFGHARTGHGADGIDLDVVLRAFEFQRVHEADQAKLGAAVIGLAEIAVKPGGGGGDHDAAILLIAHDLPDGLGRFHRAHHMHRHHGVEILDLHFGEALVAQDAGIGDQNVDPAPLIHGLLDEVGNTGVVGH